MTDWHLASPDSTIHELGSDLQQGLNRAEVQARLHRYGSNELRESGRETPIKAVWEQVSAPMALVLIAAAAGTGLLGDLKGTIAISIIAIIFVLTGFMREYRADRTIPVLRKMLPPRANVLREGLLQEIPARALVPGDLLQLETGNVVPADVRLLEAVNLRIQESALTGKPDPVEKQTAALSGNGLPLSDRRNMAYMGSIVTQGRGLAVVVATGMQTELGKIADLIEQEKGEPSRLQKRLNRLGRHLVIGGAVVAAIMALAALPGGVELRLMLLAAISLAAAIVPAALPAAAVLTLALGAQRLLKQNALIRRLPAVETLGSVTVICSDKTGTLTENRMTVVVLDVADHSLDLTEEVNRSGSFTGTRGLAAPAQSALSLTAIGGALCNDASLIDIGDDCFHTLGDPTEGALVTAAAKMGYWKSSLDLSFPRAAELPFDSQRKRMTTLHDLSQYDPNILAGLDIGDHRYIAFTKGSVDGLLGLSDQIWMNGQAHKMDEDFKRRIEAANERLASKGMRTLAVAFRLMDQVPEIIQTDLERNLTFIGLFGMIDPPRDEVRDAVAMTKSAGIRTIMITGDRPITAVEIARQLGIMDPQATGPALKKVLTGAELEKLSPEELEPVMDQVQVFARVSPAHKLRIVQALQERGHIVSMTGESVNDAPALRRADIGAAMGITGTEVSKEAADIVLLDDNFATIVNAVKEGRTISENLRRLLRFAVAGNIGRALVVLLMLLAGRTIPLPPLQLLWLSFLIDGLLGLGISREKPERGLMKRPPRSSGESVFSRDEAIRVSWAGALTGAIGAGLGAWYYFSGRLEWQTMVFTFLAFAQIFQALVARSDKESLFRLGLLSNSLLAGLSGLVVLLQLALLYVPPLTGFFDLKPPSLCDLSIAIAGGVVVFAAMEMQKRLGRSRNS